MVRIHFPPAVSQVRAPVGCAVVWSCGGSAAVGTRFEQLAAVASPRRIPLLAPCPVSAAILGSAADIVDGRFAMSDSNLTPRIEQLAPELEKIISTSEPIEHLADGFGGAQGPAEGPLWWDEGG